jgi:hypothetical protein
LRAWTFRRRMLRLASSVNRDAIAQGTSRTAARGQCFACVSRSSVRQVVGGPYRSTSGRTRSTPARMSDAFCGRADRWYSVFVPRNKPQSRTSPRLCTTSGRWRNPRVAQRGRLRNVGSHGISADKRVIAFVTARVSAMQ